MKPGINGLIYHLIKDYLADRDAWSRTTVRDVNEPGTTLIVSRRIFFSPVRTLRSVCRSRIARECASASNLRSVDNRQQQCEGCARGSDASAAHAHTRVFPRAGCTDVSLMSRLIDGTGLRCRNRRLHSSPGNVPLTRGNYSNKIAQLPVRGACNWDVTGAVMHRVISLRRD